MNKRWKLSFVLSLLLLPLVFINNHGLHDWGDDFAHYLIQSEYQLSSDDLSEMGVVDEDYSLLLGPQHRPTFFPFILGVTGANKMNFTGTQVVLSIIYFLLALVVFWFLNNHFDEKLAFILTLIFAYNPGLILFKSELMSDVLFTLLFLLVVSLIALRKSSFLAGIFLGLLCSTKHIGFILFVPILLEILKNWKNRVEVVKLSFTWIFLPLGIYFLFNRILWDISNESISWYRQIFSWQNLPQTISTNFSYYVAVVENFFHHEILIWANQLASKGFLVLTSIGVVISFKKWNIINGAFIAYLLVILCYPYHKGGFRFILPIFPLLLYYSAVAIQWFFKTFKLTNGLALVTLITGGFFFFLPYTLVNYENITSGKRNPIEGPFTPDSQELFLRLNQMPVENELISVKPWALMLYTHHKAYPVRDYQSSSEILELFHDVNPSYIVNVKPEKQASIFYAPLNQLLIDNPQCFRKKWENNTFEIFTFKP